MPMLAAVPAWVGWTAVAMSAVGTGVSVYSAYQSAATNEAIANRNAKIQSQNQRAQLQLGLAQAEMQTKQADAQADAQAAAAQAGIRNAEATRQWADAAWDARRNDMEKQRRENLRLQARQRSQIAKSELVETGSPLAVLAEQAGAMHLDLEEQAWLADVERRQSYADARNQEFEGKMGMFASGMTRMVGGQQAALDTAAARAGFANGMSAIRLGLAGARAESSAMRWQAAGNFASNLGSTAYMGYQMAYNANHQGSTTPQAVH